MNIGETQRLGAPDVFLPELELPDDGTYEVRQVYTATKSGEDVTYEWVWEVTRVG